MERIYGRVWYMEKREELVKYKRSSSRIWEEDEYKSKKTRKVRYSKEKRL